jgi:hypothetical protein
MNPFQNLPAVSAATLAAFEAACGAAESEVVALCLAEDAPAASMGPDAPTALATGMHFVSGMLRTSMRYAAGEILADQMAWGQTRLPVSGVSNDMVGRNLERYRSSLARHLSAAAFAEVRPYLDAMLAAVGAGARHD